MAIAADATQPPMTEPVSVPCLFLTGGAVEVTLDVIRFVGWVLMPDLGGETTERRIAVRFAMPADTFRPLFAQATRAARKSAN